MTDFTDMPDHLARLGSALHAATTDDAQAQHRAAATITRRAAPQRLRSRRRGHRGTVLGVVAILAVPGVAYAAVSLISGKQVAESMPAGTLAMAGTHPRCVVVKADVEYACTLETAPSGDRAIAPGQWLRTVEVTVDATQHVNGGCRSLNAEGTKWSCYIGQEAVRQQIVGQQLLGQPDSTPGVG